MQPIPALWFAIFGLVTKIHSSTFRNTWSVSCLSVFSSLTLFSNRNMRVKCGSTHGTELSLAPSSFCAILLIAQGESASTLTPMSYSKIGLMYLSVSNFPKLMVFVLTILIFRLKNENLWLHFFCREKRTSTKNNCKEISISFSLTICYRTESATNRRRF